MLKSFFKMSKFITSPLHGGLMFETVPKPQTTGIQFIPKSNSLVGGLREELQKKFARMPNSQIITDLDERLNKCLEMSVECIKPEELKALLARDDYVPFAYDGFEPSGRMHIAQGFGRVHKVNQMAKIGVKTVFWIADWFAMLNDKMGGDLNSIRAVGQYFIHVWKAAGMDMNSVQFLWASEEIGKNPQLYWQTVMDISRSFNITRVKRCIQALGRIEGDDKPAATLLYPAMQCADVFYIGADICQLGLDQRKINMLAREYCEIKRLEVSPVILSNKMLPGLLQGQEKMSKSNPQGAIFMEDTEEQVASKIKKAYCPPNQVEGNPCVAYFTDIVLPHVQQVTIARSEENGGPITFTNANDLCNAYTKGQVHPGDLKPALAKYINLMLDPVRKYMEVCLKK
ncbi:bifunctional Rossmann-like alpha-beta-alpha sandwich fold/Aminoacyl-tRNA synthetase [Babesia duncani]|uniref:tyrosine--tRNA ligase n=1 Tax=Babesia duncani TaxID=323732 RepID=A0AAD9PPC1_9APIC|nr:bifunctional Rossmann-like alpha-beta-alpha sandwich fold/Aminoacyl-tRNA synthetase [Babesia duncani]